jgi:hypothetical protein
MNDRSIDRSIDTLIDRSNYRLWMIDLLIHWLIDRIIDYEW